MSAELIHRLHFAFTVTFHYLFPQLTMGLALLIVVLKTVALRTGSEAWDRAARFWGRIFAINFVFGVVTGIPMEFEFGTNWARFSRLSGGVIGQPLAMEGVFSFFLESAFLGLFLYGEKRISKRDALVFGGDGLAGLVDLGILHHRDRRVDAAPGGLRPPARRAVRGAQLLAAAAESLGPAAVRAQHDRRGGDGLVCDGGGGRVLPAGGPPHGVRAHLSEGGRDCGRDLVDRHHLSHRRPARQVRGAQPAGGDCGDGGAIPHRDRRGDRADGPAQRGDAARSTTPSW